MHDRLSQMFNLLSEYRRAQLRDEPSLMLGTACKTNNIADVMLVLAHYPDAVRWRDGASGKTALHLAIEHRNLEIANLLMQQGADIHAVDHRGTSCLMLARLRGWSRTSVDDEPISHAQARRARRAYEEAMRAGDTARRAQQQRRSDASAHTARSYDAPKTPTTYDAGGKASFATDPQGYILSDSGDVAVFDDHKAASRWILTVGNRANVAQVFEIANHPTRDRAFTVQARKIAPQAAQQAGGPKGP